ncbi:MAG: PadR family transcriptional regulator, partial [Pseudanabaena sp.]
GYIMPDEILIEEIKRRKKLHQQKLAHYHSVEAEINIAELTRPQRHMYLTLRCGIRYETSWIEWCDEAIEQLQQE